MLSSKPEVRSFRRVDVEVDNDVVRGNVTDGAWDEAWGGGAGKKVCRVWSALVCEGWVSRAASICVCGCGVSESESGGIVGVELGARRASHSFRSL